MKTEVLLPDINDATKSVDFKMGRVYRKILLIFPERARLEIFIPSVYSVIINEDLLSIESPKADTFEFPNWRIAFNSDNGDRVI